MPETKIVISTKKGRSRESLHNWLEKLGYFFIYVSCPPKTGPDVILGILDFERGKYEQEAIEAGADHREASGGGGSFGAGAGRSNPCPPA